MMVWDVADILLSTASMPSSSPVLLENSGRELAATSAISRMQSTDFRMSKHDGQLTVLPSNSTATTLEACMLLEEGTPDGRGRLANIHKASGLRTEHGQSRPNSSVQLSNIQPRCRINRRTPNKLTKGTRVCPEGGFTHDRIPRPMPFSERIDVAAST